jgi:hypothetical protein
MRTRSGLAIVIIAVLALTGCTKASAENPAPSPTSDGSDSTGIHPDTAGTAVFSSILTTPHPVRASDGAWHITYELVLTDATSASLRIDRIEVLDATARRTLLTLTGSRLTADFTPIGGRTGDEQLADPKSTGSRTMSPSSTWVVWLDMSVAARDDVPTELEHRVVGSAQHPAGSGQTPFDYTVSRVRTAPAGTPVLAPPVSAGDWLMSEGCCSDDTHHRRGIAPINGELQVPERFGIDFFKLDADNRAWVGDPSRLSSYLSYRQPVLSVADGTVVASRNDLPNNTEVPKPPKKPPIDEAVGNFVIVRLASGVFVLYGHLDPGSVTVAAGQRVAEGSRLGLIGSSGNSTTPHLHFQTLTEPTFFPSDSLPYVFDRFDLLGRVPDRIWDDDLGLRPTGTLPFVPEPSIRTHSRQLPLDRTVVRFRMNE